jgi:hypothetical protein
VRIIIGIGIGIGIGVGVGVQVDTGVFSNVVSKRKRVVSCDIDFFCLFCQQNEPSLL